MALIRPEALPRVTVPVAGDSVLIDGATARSILVSDFLSNLPQTINATKINGSTANGVLYNDAGGVLQVAAPTPIPNLTSGQRRQLRKIVNRVEQITQADRLFFERFPARQHRVRLASQAEIEERRILENLPPIPDGLRFFTVVRQIAPCIRMRALVVAPGDAETDMPESRCRAIFQQVAGRFA